jgi:hypothetical protein
MESVRMSESSTNSDRGRLSRVDSDSVRRKLARLYASAWSWRRMRWCGAWGDVHRIPAPVRGATCLIAQDFGGRRVLVVS